MVTKALGWLFFILTLVNGPIFFFYYTKSSPQTVYDFFGMLSLGNVGSVREACGEANLAVTSIEGLTLACSYGTLETLKNFGLSNSADSSCESSDFLMDECTLQTNFFIDKGEGLQSYFD
jgi:hypothetical protein